MHNTSIAMGEFLMKTRDYYGWQVIANDPMYDTLLAKNKDITKADQVNMAEILKKYAYNQRTALDIGCHYGFFTKFLSANFEQVHAFDFPTDILECCKLNLKDYKNVTIHDHGIGDTNTSVATNDWFAKNRRRGPLGMHVDPTGGGRLHPIRTVDSLKLRNVDLMMIDTEGYELNVLKGAQQTIKQSRPIIVLEFSNKALTHKFGYNLDELEQYLIKMEYLSLGYINVVDRVFVPTGL